MAPKRPSLDDVEAKREEKRTGRGYKTYTDGLKHTEKVSTGKVSKKKTVVSLRMPEDVATLLDEVYSRKAMKNKSINKGEMAAELLRPILKAELIKLLKEEQERLMNMNL